MTEDTIFANNKDISNTQYFRYPRESSTDIEALIDETKFPDIVNSWDGKEDKIWHIKKTGDGEVIDNFLTVGYLERRLRLFPADYAYKKTFFQDESCYMDAAKLLVPRAVEYSKKAFEYFFRGKLEISLPSAESATPHPKDGIYAYTDQLQGNVVFNDLTVCIKNNTKNNDGIVVEDMVGGTISLVIRYRLPEGGEGVDQFQSEEPPMPDENSLIYQVFHQDKIVEIDNEEINLAIDEKQKIPSDKNMKVKFDISSNPIPVNATDLSIQVIYKGDIGKFEEGETPEIVVYEKDSVAVGYKDISEPTPIDIVNDSNWGFFGGIWYNLSEPCIEPKSSNCTGSWKTAFDQANCSNDDRIDPSFEKSVYPVTLWLGLINFNGTPNTVSYNEGSEATDNYYINYNVNDEGINKKPETLVLGSWKTDTLVLPVPINSDFRYYILADIDKPVVVNYRHYVQLGVSYSQMTDTVALGDRSVKTFQNKLKWSDTNYSRSLSNLLTLYRGKYRHNYLPFFHLLEPSITASITEMKNNELVDVVLAWDASHDCITEVKLDEESKALIGEVIKKPSETTTYTFTFTRNDNTTFEKNITVTVVDPE